MEGFKGHLRQVTPLVSAEADVLEAFDEPSHADEVLQDVLKAFFALKRQEAAVRPASRDRSSLDALQQLVSPSGLRCFMWSKLFGSICSLFASSSCPRSRLEQLEASMEQLRREQQDGLSQRFNDMDKAFWWCLVIDFEL